MIKCRPIRSHYLKQYMIAVMVAFSFLLSRNINITIQYINTIKIIKPIFQFNCKSLDKI